LLQCGLLDAAGVVALREEVEAQIEAGLEFAQNSPSPVRVELTRYVYAPSNRSDQ
jgi:acetoin:2,6-dichlorophenolindophenol oxidoreductase subunit alpha